MTKLPADPANSRSTHLLIFVCKTFMQTFTRRKFHPHKLDEIAVDFFDEAGLIHTPPWTHGTGHLWSPGGIREACPEHNGLALLENNSSVVAAALFCWRPSLISALRPH